MNWTWLVLKTNSNQDLCSVRIYFTNDSERSFIRTVSQTDPELQTLFTSLQKNPTLSQLSTQSPPPPSWPRQSVSSRISMCLICTWTWVSRLVVRWGFQKREEVTKSWKQFDDILPIVLGFAYWFFIRITNFSKKLTKSNTR